MASGWQYRIGSVAGVVLIVAGTLFVTNTPIVQRAFVAAVPLFHDHHVWSIGGTRLVVTLVLTVGVVVGALLPLYKPQPRRKLDTIALSQKRVLTAVFALATIGYFKWSVRLPRAMLTMIALVLLVAIPAWFLLIRTGPETNARAVVVGTDPDEIRYALATAPVTVLGYLSPPFEAGTGEREGTIVPDGGETTPDGGRATFARSRAEVGEVGPPLDQVRHFGGLSRLEDVLVEQDIDTVVLAFSDADRGEFFGTLDACYDHGVSVLVHRNHTGGVLLTEGREGLGEYAEVALEPWDWQDYLLKRLFDVTFAGAALAVLAPVIAVIALAIKLDSPGPVLYAQDRTAGFGGTFTVYKFRSMVTDAEAETGATVSVEDSGDVDPRVTRVGHVLRRTHLDEIPQLWSILAGDMSVVGPRPERPELDDDMQREAYDWRKRWFVKPGLTGLAQINDATGHQPEEKLNWDVEYIAKQSLAFDVEIVIRQLWIVLTDVLDLAIGR
ncbi:sugar transferase [Natronorarus salvus]|uniref:sugar transferase n=1 Tax=Natronorarus salvus TaxID=3117733 RepID=UPI002F262A31